MRYMKKPVYVEAVPYTKGLEDGFGCTNLNIFCDDKHDSYDKDRPCCKKCKAREWNNRKPYIQSDYGVHFVNEGDYLVTSSEGKKYAPVPPDKFFEIYEEVKEADGNENN